MRIRRVLSVTVLLGAMLLSACNAQNVPLGKDSPGTSTAPVVDPKPQGKLRIGLLAILSGGSAFVGESVRNGAQLAVDEINAKGGVNGRQIELVVEDSGSTAQGATAAAKKILEEKIDLLLGTQLSTMGLALSPVLKDAKMPTLTYGSHPDMIKEGRPWVFRIIPAANIEAKVPVDYTVKELKLTKVGIIHENSEFGTNGAKIITDVLQTYGITPVSVATSSPDDKDLTPQLARLRDKGAQAIFVWQTGAAGALAVKQAHQLGINAVLIGSGGLGNAQVIKVLTPEERANLQVVLVSTVYNTADPAVKQFYENFQKKWNKVPDQNAASYYDAVYLAAQALLKAKETSPEAIRDAIASISGYHGVSNDYSFDDSGECCKVASIVKFAADGTPQQISIIK